MPVLKLKDDITEIDFIASNDYSLEDSTLSISMPQINDTRYASVGSGEDLVSSMYGNRNITFSFFVHGNNDKDINDKLTAISRILVRNTEPTYIRGSVYSGSRTTAIGNNTGESGMVLVVRLHDIAGDVNKKKEDNTIGFLDLSVVYKVITANMDVDSRYASAKKMADGAKAFKMYAKCDMTLEVSPFGYGQPYVVLDRASPGYRSRPLAPWTGTTNHAAVVIPSADISGDAPALTRIYTKITEGSGLIIGREAGMSLLRSPGYPTSNAGVRASQLSIFGQLEALTSGINYHKVKVSSTSPLQIQHSTNNGTGYGAAVNVSAGVPFSLGTSGASGIFHSVAGLVLNDEWTYVPHQVAVQNAGSSLVIGTNSAANQEKLYSKDGIEIGEFNINVSPGVNGRYKLYNIITITNFTGHAEFEVCAHIKYVAKGVGSFTNVAKTQLDWNMFANPYLAAPVSLGVIDATARGSQISSHPNAITNINVKIFMRALTTIPISNTTAVASTIYPIPYQDENSFLHIGWGTGSGSGHQVFSNFDIGSPYFGFVSANFLDGHTNQVSVGALDETHAGNCITLIPGVDNTLVFLPLDYGETLSVTTPYWKNGIMSDDATRHTGKTAVVVKPRYLYGA